jgi:RNA polymerase sigma-70 factor (ECF subfamily)
MEPNSHAESLLENGPRLRALARRLVHDDHSAEDLVQETWVRAVERGPSGAATPWQWLARVLRNLAFEDHRLRATRMERERSVARSETGGGDEAQRFGMHRELVSAIESLEEPYRRAILLRYFDGLAPRQIAARLGIPVKTVKTRLNRGIALLREALDRKHGSREGWLAAMLPLARMRPASPRSLAPTAAAGAAKLAAAAAVVGAGLYLAWPGKGADPVTVPAPALPMLAAAAPEPVRLGAPREARRDAGTPAAAAAPRSSDASAGAGSSGGSPARSTAGLQVHVLDADGNGLVGVEVGFEGASETMFSGPDGVLTVALPSSGGNLVCRDTRFATVLGAEVDPASPASEYFVVVAPAVTLAGIVLSDGPEFPAAHARVGIEVPLSFRGRFRAVLDHCYALDWSTHTDAQGRFELHGAPGLACARIEAFDEFGRGSVPVPELGSTTIEIAYQTSASHSSAPSGNCILQIGEVRHADGNLAPWTLVAAAGRITRSDAEALFELAVPKQSASGTELVAVARGEQAASFTPARDPDGTQHWPSFASLVLGPPSLSIAGTVHGTDGAPLDGAQVWIEDPAFVGHELHGFVTLERQMGGAADGWPLTSAGSGGHFELSGLLARGYRLAAMDMATLQVVHVGPIEAGTSDLQIAFPAEGLWPRVAGRLIDTHGAPVGGLSVARTVISRQMRSPEGSSSWGSQEWMPEVTSDELGRFELERVPRTGVILAPREFPNVQRALDPDEDPLAIVIVVPHVAHLQIELAADAPAQGSVAILDAVGTPLTFYVYGGGSVSTRSQVDLANADEFSGGRTPALSVPDTAAAVVLRDAHGNELRRVPVELGDELTSVTL